MIVLKAYGGMKTICLYYNLGRIFTIRATSIEKPDETNILNMCKIRGFGRIERKAGALK